MKVRVFVMGSASLLAVWLAATFLSDVPVERYPQYGKGSVPVSAKAAKAQSDKPIATAKTDETPVAIFE
ncbi:hypothetical protein OKA05_06985 [Luteolibacter arcticus]|uniref:Efflux transporter periplasmic adaptor subunit n=1 Tax=Luteolibacter arcticus TaxID=1581411 RepID=A0ABT3GFA0_9BACT|nr:hypothetical protein [Luteolibacter arcticus]MCW1922292.1 hypothetical protein [Luteolibacter arcticus]